MGESAMDAAKLAKLREKYSDEKVMHPSALSMWMPIVILTVGWGIQSFIMVHLFAMPCWMAF